MAAQALTNRRPMIRARVRLTLSGRHVDGFGFLDDRAVCRTAHAALAGLPAGASVTVALGSARHPSVPLLRLILEHLDGGELAFEGEARIAGEWVAVTQELAS